MKKQMVNFAFVAVLIGSIAAGCSSVNETVNSDSATVDSSSLTAPRDTVVKPDTVRRDSVTP